MARVFVLRVVSRFGIIDHDACDLPSAPCGAPYGDKIVTHFSAFVSVSIASHRSMRRNIETSASRIEVRDHRSVGLPSLRTSGWGTFFFSPGANNCRFRVKAASTCRQGYDCRATGKKDHHRENLPSARIYTIVAFVHGGYRLTNAATQPMAGKATEARVIFGGGISRTNRDQQGGEREKWN